MQAAAPEGLRHVGGAAACRRSLSSTALPSTAGVGRMLRQPLSSSGRNRSAGGMEPGCDGLHRGGGKSGSAPRSAGSIICSRSHLQ